MSKDWPTESAGLDPEPPLTEVLTGSRMGRSMPAAPSRTNGPLGAEEQQLADRTARRLHAALREVLAALPAESRSASGLSRLLDLDRTTCHRMVSVARERYSGPHIIGRLPGVPGLRRIAGSLRETMDESESPVGSLDAAIEGYDRVIARLGGSQSGLIRRLNATPLVEPSPAAGADSGGHAPAPHAQQLFEAATELTGRCSDTWVAVYLYHPKAGDPDHLWLSRVYGLIGHRARTDAVPLTFHNFSSPSQQEREAAADGAELATDREGRFFRLDEAAIKAGATPDVILPDFTTDPIPLVSSKKPGHFLVQSIDVEEGRLGAVDLMLGNRTLVPHPRTQEPNIEETWAMVNFPVRRMLLDVYLHRDLASRCIADLDVHLWRPDFASTVGDRWQTRFAHPPRLQMLGRGIRNAATDGYDRHGELTEFIFSASGLDPDAFVGHRCDVLYPMWRTGYCMSFDFTDGRDDPS